MNSRIDDIESATVAAVIARNLLPKLLAVELKKVKLPPQVSQAGINQAGQLVLSFSDGTTQIVGHVKGREGTPGVRGPRGQRGARGCGIKLVEHIGAALRLTLDDGDVAEFPLPAGPPGPVGKVGGDGADGRSIIGVDLEDADMLVFKFSDGLTEHVQLPELYAGAQGDRGPAGPQGEPGDPGNGIAAVWLSADYHLWFRFDDGTHIDVGVVPRGMPGPKGAKGDPGKDGTDGKDGAEGAAGKDGAPGSRGPAGRDGKDGIDGIDGAAGADGAPGSRGPAGRDGADGQQGPQGEAGPAGPAGERGPQGPQGEAGPAGPAGERGPQGPPGKEGAPGPRGEQGPAGTNGQDGQAGADGEPGRGISRLWLDGYELKIEYDDGYEGSVGFVPVIEQTLDVEALAGTLVDLVGARINEDLLAAREARAKAMLEVRTKLVSVATSWS